MNGFLAITLADAISCIQKFHNESRHANRFYPMSESKENAAAAHCA
jgi:hypothetical protein